MNKVTKHFAVRCPYSGTHYFSFRETAKTDQIQKFISDAFGSVAEFWAATPAERQENEFELIEFSPRPDRERCNA